MFYDIQQPDGSPNSALVFTLIFIIQNWGLLSVSYKDKLDYKPCDLL